MVHAHFVAAAEIWSAFFAGKISVRVRDELLEPLRRRLAGR